MVELEFDTIWKQLQEEVRQSGTEAAGKSEDELKAEYRAIADRRVRLGLLLSEIGRANELRVEQAELNAAVTAQARRYPGEEQRVIDYFRRNPQAIEQLRAPLYEDKVVDFVLQMATLSDQKVAPEELLRDPDDEPAPAAVAEA
jgi:trigger factor